ncbi:hypothetical protein H6503_06865 [Candidatus Woesearchaeota archaeon]|nr:hypothetical protein [Candidatus Woesearchaeota archaeon]
MKVYCFGNEFLENDSFAKEIADEISFPGIEFVKCDSPDEIFLEEKEIWILDVVDEIDDVILIDDVDKLKENYISTLHDFDLSYFLKLMKEMGRLNSIKIIGIPMKGDKEEIMDKIVDKLKENFS